MKTTQAQFAKFKERCEYWQKELGLLNFKINYKYQGLPGKYAETSYKMSDGLAVIRFAKTYDETYEALDIDRIALHEVLHILLAQLIVEAEDRFTNQMAIDIAEHAIIRTLEAALIHG